MGYRSILQRFRILVLPFPSFLGERKGRVDEESWTRRKDSTLRSHDATRNESSLGFKYMSQLRRLTVPGAVPETTIKTRLL